jgi:hypothetical protein
MWIPWRNRTGLAKAAVILATVLSIGTVSCGLNYALAMGSNNSNSSWALPVLIFTGWVELAAMVASVVGLLVVLVIWLASKGREATRKDTND